MDDDADSLLDRIRDMGVGTEDPNIIGDAGPTDVPPGADPPGDDLEAVGADDGAEPADWDEDDPLA
ncbi:MAG: hypothetical protein ACLGIO_04540 [Acidimicrobiia bacterium]